LVELGVIEVKGRGRGVRYLLSERFYSFTEARGSYTRRKGLDHETNKALLLDHIERNKVEGSPLRDLHDVLPAQSRKQVQHLLTELRREDKAHARGKTRSSRWFPGGSGSGEDR